MYSVRNYLSEWADWSYGMFRFVKLECTNKFLRYLNVGLIQPNVPTKGYSTVNYRGNNGDTYSIVFETERGPNTIESITGYDTDDNEVDLNMYSGKSFHLNSNVINPRMLGLKSICVQYTNTGPSVYTNEMMMKL